MEQVRGYHYLAYVHPDDRAVADDLWRAFCLGTVQSYDETFRWNHPEGWKHLRIQGGRRANGQNYGIVTDVTDHIHYQRKLRKVHSHALE